MCVCGGGGFFDKVLEDNIVDTGSGTKNVNNNTSESGCELEETTRSRHLLKNPEFWKQNIRKRNAGRES